MKPILLFSFVMLQAFCSLALSQEQCGSTFDVQQIQTIDPTRYNRYLQVEQHIANYLATMNNGNPNARLINQNSIITIPVVVHVLHNGEPVGVGNNLSVPQIESQIDVLNEDFRRLNADRFNTPGAFTGVAGDPRIEFRLACIDPNGNATNGINRVFTTVGAFTYQQNPNGSVNEQATGIKFTAQGGTNAWPTDRYLNMWVCNIAPSPTGQLLGYAQFPFDYTASPNTDGVVMLNTAFGRVGTLRFNFDLGRTTTHEVGHWLNLFHVWGDDGGACNGSDQCDDTPNQGGANQSNCPVFPRVTCGNGPNGDMFMNYMDYTVDGCKNIYTQGQTNRMRAVFAQGGPRAAFIENYFRVNPPTSPICNLGSVSVTNPNCLLPVIWTVVSGPANVSGGQGTNTVTLQQTGNGTAVIRATSGGYVDEENVTMGTPAATGISGFSPTIGVSPGEILELDAFEDGQPIYNWTINGGTIVGNATGRHITVIVDNPCNGFITNGYFNAAVSYTNACGTGAAFGANCYIVCGTGGGGPMFAMSPNPSPGNVTIDGRAKNKKVKEVQVLDKLGAVKKVVKYSGDQKLVNVNISNLPADLYYIKIFDGEKWEAKQLRKQ